MPWASRGSTPMPGSPRPTSSGTFRGRAWWRTRGLPELRRKRRQRDPHRDPGQDLRRQQHDPRTRIPPGRGPTAPAPCGIRTSTRAPLGHRPQRQREPGRQPAAGSIGRGRDVRRHHAGQRHRLPGGGGRGRGATACASSTPARHASSICSFTWPTGAPTASRWLRPPPSTATPSWRQPTPRGRTSW